jgi:4-diphosphocytidyl-2-C-methyl-D-erythritol kinase
MLHVVGRTQEGLHHLQTLMYLMPGPDKLVFHPANSWKFTVNGSFPEIPVENNLVIQALQFMQNQGLLPSGGAHICLEKHVPLSSGVGGGSANAATTIKGLLDFFRIRLNPGQARKIVQSSASLGADVPVCLAYLLQPEKNLFWLDGTGKEGTPQAFGTPFDLPVLLVNPKVPLSTPHVFQAFQEAGAAYVGRKELPPTGNLMPFLGSAENTLTPFSCTLAPEVGDILNTLSSQPGCFFSRMTGSGATCFAVFETPAACRVAYEVIQACQPQWWVYS